MIYYIILSAVVAFVIGFIFGNRPKRKIVVGTLRIDRSEPDEAPLLFLELSTDPRNLMREKQVLLDVSTESYLSQE